MQSRVIWGLTDGSAGMASQVRGVGELLAVNTNSQFILKSARRIKPFCWLPGYVHFGALKQLTNESDGLEPPYPDILISSGRRSVAIALAIKKASRGKTKLVHLQGPRIPLHHFDLVVPMEHDKLSGINVINTFAALHHITDEKLQAAKQEYLNMNADKLPQAALFMGGSTHTYKLTEDRMGEVIQFIKHFAAQYDGNIGIATSRRTGKKNTRILQAVLGNEMQIYDGKGYNPYLAWMALADILIVTNDSVSMMSEALYAGKRVYILELPEHKNTTPARFAETLISRGLAKPFSWPLENYVPRRIDERTKVIELVIKLFQ